MTELVRFHQVQVWSEQNDLWVVDPYTPENPRPGLWLIKARKKVLDQEGHTTRIVLVTVLPDNERKEDADKPDNADR